MRRKDQAVTMRQWLARLSFSFFIVAAVLAWEAYKASGGGSAARASLCTLGAVVAVGLGLLGIRERHRPE
jgi:hypothetical protein